MNISDYRPVKRAFLVRRLTPPLFIIGALSLTALFLAETVGSFVYMLIALLLVVAAIVSVNANVAFNKQLYSLRDRAIFYTTGSFFSDKETELKYRNITHVRLIKPFIEYKLFGTGRILIEAAGSSGSEVVMQSVANPEAVYKQIQKTMADKEFRLTYNQLLSKERPEKIAVILEVLGGVAGTIFVVALTAPGLVGVPLAIADVLPNVVVVLLALIIGIVIVAGGGFYVYALYQDLLRRTYYIYDDVICYERGFLTKQQAFIPVENLSDAELTQNFLDKILGLYDVVISCQGSGSEIPFRNLRNGKEVERVIDGLINTVDPLIDSTDGNQHVAATAEAHSVEQSTPIFAEASNFQASYRMNMRRTLLVYAPLLPLLIVFPPLLVLPIYSFIVVKQTEFKLTAKGVASYFTFLTTKNVEFTSDKITGVIVKRNLIDRWFSTCTVEFWSIGSTSAVRFRNIDYTDGLDRIMKEKAGIYDDDELEQFQPQFNVREMIKANLYVHIPIVVILLGSIIASYWSLYYLYLAGVVIFAEGIVVYLLGRRCRRARLRYGTRSVSYRIGWLREVRYYVLYGNVKDATITAYPFSQKGTIKFNIAGEQAVQTGNSGTQYRPNAFSVRYVQNADGSTHIHEHILDRILYHEPASVKSYQQLRATGGPRQIVHSSRPSLKNSIIPAVVLHIILFPTIVLMPITLFAIRFWVRRISYCVEEDYRVVKLSGVLYRHQTSIVLPKLDYIKKGQRFMNKLCRNGNIYLYTTGSRSAELTLLNMPDYNDFHQGMKRQYEQ